VTLTIVTVAIIVTAGAVWYALRQRRARLTLQGRVAEGLGQLGFSARTINPGHALESAANRVAQRLADAESKSSLYAGAMGAAEFGVIVVDSAGSVVFANPAAQRYVKARHGDAVAELQMRRLIDDVTDRRRYVRTEVELYTPTRRIVGLHAVPLESRQGRPTGAVVYLEDLTARRRIDAIRKDFVANTSHELKTPLGAMTILAETLAETDDTATRLRLADRLSSETRRLSRLVDDILDLSLVEGTTGDAVPVSIDEVIADATKQVETLSEELGVGLDTTPIGPAVKVVGDRRQLVSAVSNLLENAIKYTSVARLDAAPPVRLSANATADDVTVTVTDGGIGIAEPHHDRIFERFYRVDRARSRDTGGTGLGLAIVRHVVRNHDGKIEVQSEPGRGSTFRITLPRWSE
jgi:two-component system sensor histidine kinase SenX3